MVDLIQSIRSATPNKTPTNGTRLPGELWTNWPDLQMGVIDASQNAQPLLAVRYFSALTGYNSGDFVVQGGKLWVAKASTPPGAFNASQWTSWATTNDLVGAYLPLTGGTLTGLLTLSGPPTANLHAATKAYVDGKGSASAPLMDGAVAAGVATAWSCGDHRHPTDTTRAPLDSPNFTGSAFANVMTINNLTVGASQNNGNENVTGTLNVQAGSNLNGTTACNYINAINGFISTGPNADLRSTNTNITGTCNIGSINNLVTGNGVCNVENHYGLAMQVMSSVNQAGRVRYLFATTARTATPLCFTSGNQLYLVEFRTTVHRSLISRLRTIALRRCMATLLRRSAQ